MLKQSMRGNLETVVQMTLQQYGSEETLAFDLAKQCVTEEDVNKCLSVMFEHVSEEELTSLTKLLESNVFKRYTQAVTESMRVIDERIADTLRLLNTTEGSC
jgi:hypothetical protein